MTSQPDSNPSIAINVEMRTTRLTTQSCVVTRFASSNGPSPAVHGSTRRDICPSSPPSHEVPELEFSGAAELSHLRYARALMTPSSGCCLGGVHLGCTKMGSLLPSSRPQQHVERVQEPTSFGIAPRPADGCDLHWSSPFWTQDRLGRLTWKLPLSALVCLPRFGAHRSRLAALSLGDSRRP